MTSHKKSKIQNFPIIFKLKLQDFTHL